MTDPQPSSTGTGEDETPPSIRLDNVLKLAGIAETGGQAKRLIQAGEVRVNGEIETRRKHPLHHGDEVAVEGETFVVELAGEADPVRDPDEDPETDRREDLEGVPGDEPGHGEDATHTP